MELTGSPPERLLQARCARGLSRRVMAEKMSQLGAPTSPQQVQRAENGSAVPGAWWQVSAAVLDVPVQELLPPL